MDEPERFGTAGVVAPCAQAAQAARDVLIEGGNALEAAVSAAAVTAVVLPHRSGLGGDGVWLVRDARGRTRVLDARGSAGAGATAESFRAAERDAVPERGPLAVLTVPGAVGGWLMALDLAAALGGRLPLERLLEPAIAAARNGYAVAASESLAPSRLGELAAEPGFAAAFLEDGKPTAAGVLRRAPALADVLAHLAHAGLADFYRGDVGREIAADCGRASVGLSRHDLRGFETRWRDPASVRLGPVGVDAPPDVDGTALLLTLGLALRPERRSPNDAAALQALVASASHARRLVDEAVANDAGVSGLLDAAALDRERDAFGGRRGGLGLPPTHTREAGIVIAVAGRDGMAACLVQSLGSAFGSGMVLTRTGLLLGNRGSRFSLSRGPGHHLLRPAARPPLDSLPVIAGWRDGRVVALGAAGTGSGDAAAQVLALVTSGVPVGEAVARPRFFRDREAGSEGPVLRLEPGFDPSVAAALARAGYPVAADASWNAGAAVSLVDRGRAGTITVAPDAGGESAAAGF